jgi:hypothetical protein
MKFKYSTIALAFAAITLNSCEKDDSLNLAPTEGIENAAAVKIVHASAYTINTPIHLKIDDVRVSSNITYAYPFPGGGFGTGGNSDMDYLKANAAAIKVSSAIPKVGSAVDSIPLFSGTTSVLESGKFYDVFLSDTLASTKMLVAEENIDPVASNVSRFRFANLIPNLPLADVYFGNELVAANVAYNTVSPDFLIPRDSAARWAVRAAGALPSTTAIAYYPTSATATYVVLPGRALTVFSRGYTGSTGTRIPAVSLFYNHYYR